MIYEILLRSDINTIRTYCYTKHYQEICQNNDFWKLIFERDGFPIFGTPLTPEDWINMYHKITNATKEADLILLLQKEEKIKGFWVKHPIFYNKKLFHVSDVNIPLFSSQFYVYFDNGSDYPYSINADHIIVRYNHFRELLIELLYFYPDLKIEAGANLKVNLRKKDLDLYNSGSMIGRKTVVYRYLKFYKNH